MLATIAIYFLMCKFYDYCLLRNFSNASRNASISASLLSQPRETRKALEEGLRISAHEYLAARAIQDSLSPALEPLFAEFDAILCPAAPGPAPEGLSSTGDSIFNGLWTMAGTPAVTLPLLTAPNGLPMGVQLVGRANEDARLLQTASWLWRRFEEPAGP